MSRNHRDDDAIYVDRSWPPSRLWGYTFLPAVALAIPTLLVAGDLQVGPYTAADFRAVAWTAIGLWVGIWVFVSVLGARRHWWVTPTEIGISRVPLAARIFYGFSGRESVSLSNVANVEVMEGKIRPIRERAYGTTKPHVRHGFGGACDKFWCKGALIVRLANPDDYGHSVLLSTDRPQEAARVLDQAIQAARQRWGSTT